MPVCSHVSTIFHHQWPLSAVHLLMCRDGILIPSQPLLYWAKEPGYFSLFSSDSFAIPVIMLISFSKVYNAN